MDPMWASTTTSGSTGARAPRDAHPSSSTHRTAACRRRRLNSSSTGPGATPRSAAPAATPRRGPRPAAVTPTVGWIFSSTTAASSGLRVRPCCPGPYNNTYVIAQTPDYVAIRVEMIHETRIIPLDGRPHLPSHIRQYIGRHAGALGRRRTGCGDHQHPAHRGRSRRPGQRSDPAARLERAHRRHDSHRRALHAGGRRHDHL